MSIAYILLGIMALLAAIEFLGIRRSEYYGTVMAKLVHVGDKIDYELVLTDKSFSVLVSKAIHDQAWRGRNLIYSAMPGRSGILWRKKFERWAESKS